MKTTKKTKLNVFSGFHKNKIDFFVKIIKNTSNFGVFSGFQKRNLCFFDDRGDVRPCFLKVRGSPLVFFFYENQKKKAFVLVSENISTVFLENPEKCVDFSMIFIKTSTYFFMTIRKNVKI